MPQLSQKLNLLVGILSTVIFLSGCAVFENAIAQDWENTATDIARETEEREAIFGPEDNHRDD